MTLSAGVLTRAAFIKHSVYELGGGQRVIQLVLKSLNQVSPAECLPGSGEAARAPSVSNTTPATNTTVVTTTPS